MVTALRAGDQLAIGQIYDTYGARLYAYCYDLLADHEQMLDLLRNISDHLKANDGAALKADIGDADKNLDTLLSARARNGALTNRMDAASERLDQIQQALTDQLSNTEDADYTKTMIDFNSQSVAYQAALKAGASIVQSSLMDFLH